MAWPVSSTYLKALAGSYDVSVRASVALGGKTLCESLPIGVGAAWTSEWAGQSIRDEVTLPITDDTAELLGMNLEAPLAPFGQRLQVTATMRVGGQLVESIPMGFALITDPGAESERWMRYQAGTSTVWRPSPRTYRVRASDLLEHVVAHPIVRDLAASGTLVTDSIALLDGLLPMGAWVSSTASPAGTVWTDARLPGLADLADRDGRVPAVWRDGSYLPRPIALKATPDWVISPDTNLISQQPRMRIDGIKNGVVVTGEDAAQRPTRGSAYLNAGPLRWGGPFGKRELRVSNPLARSDALATSIAEGQLANMLAKLTVPVAVRCRTNPAIDVLDTIRLNLPRQTWTGLATRVVTPLHPDDDQELEVAVPWTQVWRA